MKALAINGSPRKNQNTAKLLQAALDSAARKGAETELVNLYELQYKGCVSCFACKRKDRRHGHCVMRDELAPVLRKAYDPQSSRFPIYNEHEARTDGSFSYAFQPGSVSEQPEILYACNTYQFSDYEKYESSMFSKSEKAAYRAEQFPKDLEAAFEMGKRLAGSVCQGIFMIGKVAIA